MSKYNNERNDSLMQTIHFNSVEEYTRYIYFVYSDKMKDLASSQIDQFVKEKLESAIEVAEMLSNID